jgi:hypothetical protein
MKKEVICKNCSIKFDKEVTDINRSKNGNHFCSRNCSASYNNKIKPKRKLTRICSRKGCNKHVKSYKHSLCDEHYIEYINNKRSYYYKKTIGEYRGRKSVRDKHPSWISSHIRVIGRTMNADLLKKPCKICGYDKHVELCHIKPISEFKDDEKISDVNSVKNVVQLCRNCHWEFDHGIVELPE